jgi:hypothetical protein
MDCVWDRPWLVPRSPQSPRDVEEMKKAGRAAGWYSDTAAREEVAEIRVLSAPAPTSPFLVQDVTN